MVINTIFNLFIKIFLMVAFGYFLKKKNVINQEFQKGLNNLLLKAILPVHILASVNTEVTSGVSGRIFVTGMIALGYYICALFFTIRFSKVLKLSKKGKSVFVTMSVFANTAFVGFPLVAEVAGTEGMVYAVIYNLFYQLLFFSVGIYLLSSGEEFAVKDLLKNPVMIASLVFLVLFLTPFRFPEVVQSAMSSVGAMTVPISMMIIGASLADIPLASVMLDRNAYLVSLLRLILFPLLLWVILKLFSVDREVRTVCVLMTALPSGSLNAIFAEQYDCEPQYATRAVVQTMIFMLVTLFFIIYLVKS